VAETNIQVLIPTGRGFWPVDFTISLLSMVMHTMANVEERTELNVEVVQSSTLQQGRTDLIKKGLDNGATHLLLLDDDHTFPADTLLWLLKRDRPVVAANYARRVVGGGPVSVGLDGKPVYTRPDSTGLQAVRFSGLGVTMIQADVFRKVPEPWFDFVWESNDKGQWFIGMSEDVYLFTKLAEYGIVPHVDHDLSKHVEHIGSFNYTNFHALPKAEQLNYVGIPTQTKRKHR
jgi:hypothetical protein